MTRAAATSVAHNADSAERLTRHQMRQPDAGPLHFASDEEIESIRRELDAERPHMGRPYTLLDKEADPEWRMFLGRFH